MSQILFIYFCEFFLKYYLVIKNISKGKEGEMKQDYNN